MGNCFYKQEIWFIVVRVISSGLSFLSSNVSPLTVSKVACDHFLTVLQGGGDVLSANPISAANRAAALAQDNRQKGAVSSERARMVEDFRERQRQAMINKVRVMDQLE